MRTSQLSRLTPRHVHIAGAVLLMILGVAFAYFQGRPVVAARAELRTLTEELAARRQTLQQLQASRKDAEVRAAALRAELAERLLKLVPRSHLNERLEQLSRVVEASGMRVDKLTPAEATANGAIPSLRLRLAGHGPYEACERLIGTLHTSFVDTAITSIQLRAAPENPESPVHLDLELLWYTADEASPSR